MVGLILSAGNGCAGSDTETAGATLQAAAGSAAGSSKFHVVLGGGPYAGTYDVVSDACLSGVQKPGAWNATWTADITVKDKISGVITGIDPKPVIAGAGTTAMVSFGEDDEQVLYEVLKPTSKVTDRGSTATLVFEGKARTAFYKDGTFGEGGDLEITVECGKVVRGLG
jgi:hypothetical protein